MGHCKRSWCSIVVFCIAFWFTDVYAEDRCKDESFCRAYCLSTNPDTVSATCGRDLASCICSTPDNHAVNVRFIEKQNPVPPAEAITSEELSTDPFDPRFPNQDQEKQCFVNFLDYKRCIKQQGEDYPPCQYFKQVYTLVCPSGLVEKWESEIKEGTFF